MEAGNQQLGSMAVRRFILRSNATPQLPVHIVLQCHQTMNDLLGEHLAGALPASFASSLAVATTARAVAWPGLAWPGSSSGSSSRTLVAFNVYY